MSFAKIKVEHLEISLEKAQNRKNLDSNEPIDSNSYDNFLNFYVRNVSSLLTHVQNFYACFQHPENINCYAIKLKFSDEIIEVLACTTRKKDARNLAAARMLQEINSRMPNFFRPRNLIGLPNFRGSCFMISVVVQFFWSHLVTSSLMDFKFKHKSYKGKLLSALIKLMHTYTKVATNGSLDMINCPTNLHLKYTKPIITKLKDNPKRQGFKPELE